jgi:DNA-directed RNA polymerase subunit beta'
MAPVEGDSEPKLVEEKPPSRGRGDAGVRRSRVRADADGNLISQYIKTTTGRIIYNKTVHDALAT